MNGRFRKASALFASLAVLSATVLITSIAPAGATSPTGCEDLPGCTSPTAGGEITYNNGPFNIGVQFSVADAGQLNTICYTPGAGDTTDQVFLDGPVTASGTASGACATFNMAIPAGFYTAYYTSGTSYQQGTENATSIGVGDLTLPPNAGVYSTSGVPSITGYGDTVSVVFYSNPNPPTVTVTAATPTSANSSWTGDSDGGASSDLITCTQPGPPAPVQHGPSPVTAGTFSNVQAGLNTNGQPVTCIGVETSNVGLKSTTGTSGPVYLPPPAPTIGTVTPNPASPGTSVLVGFTNNSVGASGPTFTATCNQTGHSAQTGTSSTSPITVNGLGGPTAVTCTVHETFAFPNSLSGAESGSASGFMPPPEAITSIVPVNKSLTLVNFLATPGATYTVTCTPVAPAVGVTVTTGSSSTSPIAVTGLTNDIPYSCTVTGNFGNTAGPTTSAPFTTTLASISGPGCTPSGDVAAPTKLSAAAMAFPGAVVSWAPVATDCLSGYLITPSEGTTALPPTFVSGNETTTHVLGLTLGSTYTFTVAAVTGSGTGPASAPVGPVTIGTPAPVTSVHAARVGKGVVKVAFVAGRANGAAITRFRATCGSATVAGKSSPLIVRGLKAGKTYVCTVTATNSRGRGAAARSAAVKA